MRAFWHCGGSIALLNWASKKWKVQPQPDQKRLLLRRVAEGMGLISNLLHLKPLIHLGQSPPVHASDHEHRRKTAPRCPEVRGLTLIETRSHQKHLSIIRIQSHVHFARLGCLVDLDHALAGADQRLSNVSASRDFRPDAFRQLVATIYRLTAMTPGRLEEQVLAGFPKCISVVWIDKDGAWNGCKSGPNLGIDTPCLKRRGIRKKRKVALVGKERVVVRFLRLDMRSL